MTRYSGPDLGGTRSNEAALPGTGYKAVIFTSEKSPGGAELTGLDYTVGRRVFASDGTEVPSATIGDRTVYVDAEAGEIGVVEPDGSAQRPVPAAGSSDLPHLDDRARRGAGQPLVATTAVIVPIGAQDVSVRGAGRRHPSIDADRPAARGLRTGGGGGRRRPGDRLPHRHDRDVEGRRTAGIVDEPGLGRAESAAEGAAGPGQFRSGWGTGRPGCSPPRASR